MAMDHLFDAPGPVVVVAEDASGCVGGFVHLVPMPAAAGYSISAMRRRGSTPNGLMEFLIVETIGWGRREGISQISLNFCAFADQLRAGHRDSRAGRAFGVALRKLDRIFQLERLLVFSAKFLPEWAPRYVCLERLTDFPGVGFAYLRLESLLTPPRPWAKRRQPAGRRTTNLPP